LKSIDHKIIWITGASSGIGETLAYELSKKNCKLILSSRREKELIRVKSKCAFPKNIEILTLDLLAFDRMKTYVEKALSFFGKIDVLINNGGVSQRSLIAETDFTVDKKIMEIDYLGTVALSKALLPHFVKHQFGHFVTVSSLMGKFGSPYRSGYCGAKHALHGFFDVLRMEHEKDGVFITMICPGFVQTNIAINALTANETAQQANDTATQNGLTVVKFVKK